MKHRNHILAVVGCTVRKNVLLTLGLVFAIAGTIVTGIWPPLVLEKIINSLAGGRQILLRTVLWYFGLLALSGLFDAAKECLITLFGQKVTHGLRSEMCRKLSKLPASYYDKNEAGVTASRFVNDVDTVEALFTSGIISMVVDVCKVLSILVIVFYKSRGLGILLVLVTPFLGWLTGLFRRRMFLAQLENRVAVGKANGHVPETIRSIRMIHTFHKEAYMEKRYDSLILDSYRAMEKSSFYDAIYSPIILVVSAVLVAVMMVLSARGGAMQQFFGMSVGTAVAVIAYVGKVFDPLENIGMEIQNIQSAVAGVARINEFLDAQERLQEAAGERGPADPAIVFSDVRFGYEPGQEVLHGLSFAVKEGECMTLTGRTGIGKSTVFKLLLGFYSPQSGSVRIFGVPADSIPDDGKRKLFGYVEQSFGMIPGSVREQITLKDPEISDEVVRRALRMVGMEETVDALEKGMDTPCRPSLFSQGQLQLLSIARAVAANPRILLLDEITANLDSETEERVMEALREATKNRTVLSISHRLYAGGWINDGSIQRLG